MTDLLIRNIEHASYMLLDQIIAHTSDQDAREAAKEELQRRMQEHRNELQEEAACLPSF